MQASARPLAFTKMHGLGNDFIVIDAINQQVALSTAQIRFLADRHFGIGCDQLLLVEKPQTAQAEFRYRIFNADGGEVEQCGNGARCFAVFVRRQGLTDSTVIPVETAGGLIELRVETAADGAEQVSVDMGEPDFEPQALPFVPQHAEQDLPPQTWKLMVNGQEYAIGIVSMGNPHAVLMVDDVDTADVAGLGAAIESHPAFPQRVNVGFMQILDRGHLRLRVYERGAAETLACGTGACAAMAVGRMRELLDAQVQVSLPGGALRIDWTGPGQHLIMTGPAVSVFDGQIVLDADMS